VKISIFEAGTFEDEGADGVELALDELALDELALDELCANRLDVPSPTQPAANRIRPRELNGRECMRLSSATLLLESHTVTMSLELLEPHLPGSAHHRSSAQKGLRIGAAYRKSPSRPRSLNSQ
jgi:hypothetical protein